MKQENTHRGRLGLGVLHGENAYSSVQRGTQALRGSGDVGLLIALFSTL